MKRTGRLVGVAGVAGAVTLVCAVAYTGREPRVVVRPSAPVAHQQVAPAVRSFERLGHRAAERALEAEGVRRVKGGRCKGRARGPCPSYAGLRRGTLEGLVRFARESGCAVTVSGGTEKGGRKALYGQGNGYRVELAPTRCVDSHIRRTMPRVAVRADRAPLYRDARGDALYADERARWHVFYGPRWCVAKQVSLRRAHCE
ncbi:hypothetical protein LO762_15965 [Actinocorallia sp. API 0066]|uniref:hypothetical protein n=1 Tax=Actinocorallia sp. API 0066 TaxID=2896846 RepID=UPI001E4786BB|nr:hypothetical protein [Actinocorallia sp. API 0066]MCD0450674.1 hypothetical protein [Actinocorallia sp. API 0066]